MFRMPSMPCLRPWHSPGKQLLRIAVPLPEGFYLGMGACRPHIRPKCWGACALQTSPRGSRELCAFTPALSLLSTGTCVSRCCPELPSGVALELSRAAVDLVTRPVVTASLPVSLPPPLLVIPGITLQMKHGPMHLCLGNALRDWESGLFHGS